MCVIMGGNSVAGEGGAVTGVMRSIMNGFDVREAGKVNQAQAQQAGACSHDNALTEGYGCNDAANVRAGSDGHWRLPLRIGDGQARQLRAIPAGMRQRPPTAGC